MADLILGPVLRYVAETAATVWVETDAPCRVEILGHETATFQVEGHHYALLPITGLEPGNEYEYEVALDGKKRWPQEPGLGPSVIRTLSPDVRGRPGTHQGGQGDRRRPRRAASREELRAAAELIPPLPVSSPLAPAADAHPVSALAPLAVQ